MSPSARFAVFLSVVLAIWTLQHLYVGWRLLSLPPFAALAARRALLLVMGAGAVAYLVGRVLGARGFLGAASLLEYLGGLWMGLLLLLLAALLAVDLVSLGGTVLRPWLPSLRGCAVALALLAAAVAWWGGRRAPALVEVELATPALREEAEGLTIMQVSDLHLGATAGRSRIAQVQRILAAHPADVVVITGDLMDGDAAALRRLLPELAGMRAPGGVFAVLGNHEYYDRRGPQAAREIFAAAGYQLLENSSVEIAAGVHLVGVPDDRGAAQTGHPRADLDRALAGVPGDAVVILLQHAPGNEQQAAARGVDLMLNGHTHGGQIWPFHYLVATSYGHIAGPRRVAGMLQVVSRGAGQWGPPMRLLAPADVVRVTLRRNPSDPAQDRPPSVLPAETAGAKVPSAPT